MFANLNYFNLHFYTLDINEIIEFNDKTKINYIFAEKCKQSL